MSDINDRTPGIPVEIATALDAEILQADLPFSGSGFSGGLVFEYRWDNGTTDVDPGAGKIAGNNADEESITEIYLSVTTDTGADVGAVLRNLADNDFIVPTEKAATGRWLVAEINGAIVDNTTYLTIPVVVNQVGLPIRDNRVMLTRFVYT